MGKRRLIFGGVVITGLLFYLLTHKGQAASPQMRYSCSGPPNYTCSEDVNGAYGTIIECHASCVLQTQTIDVIVNEP